MNKKNLTEEEIMAQIEAMVDSVIDMQVQYDVYCQMMKEMFLAGSTNN